MGVVTLPTLICYAGAGCLVASVGLWDDLSHVPASWRLVVHFLGAAWGFFGMGGLPLLQALGLFHALEWLVALVIIIYLVWVLNLYNFMDGIDGIASIEALTVSLGSVLLLNLIAPKEHFVFIALLVFSSVFGFFFWNFPRAKIFLGDTGSGFLGIILGLLSIQSAMHAPQLISAWLILLGVFIVDATVTLVRRILRGEKFYEAHRSHAYQIISRRLSSHKKVTLGVLCINIIWLLPFSILAVLFPDKAFLLTLMALLPLVLFALRVGAGTTNS